MKKYDKPYDLEIIAGPCSITPENTEEIINEIAAITVDGKRAIFGTRVVGLKSRTTINPTGEGMGIDFDVIQEAIDLPESKRKKLKLPSAALAEKIAKQTGLLVATEVMIPHIQLPFYAANKHLQGNMMVWNPAVTQLGWTIQELSRYASENNWELGIKNSKFLGKDHIHIANSKDFTGETSLEKTLKGLVSFIHNKKQKPIFIHRGVDVPREDEFRNALVHEVVKRVKRSVPGSKLYLDPSHSYGPKLREHIVQGTIDAMKLQVDDDFLYDGILIEAGTSPSDTYQHITIKELQELAEKLQTFRNLRPPKTTK